MIEVESATLERHARLYLADGDVVLAARQPESHQEAHSQYQVYRVHKAILCLHSPVFANVLSDAMPGLGESYDGAPLVEMVGDEAPAFSSLLMWLYFPLEMTIERWDPDTPITVALVVRLASKYLVDTLRSHLVNTVVADWPRTLEEWNCQEAEIRAMRSDRASSMKRDNFSRLVPEPAAAIAFALEFGCTEILPAAFYTISCISITNDWDRAAPHGLDSYLRLARWSMLESRELLRFMRGCDALERYCDEKRTRPDIAMKRILDERCRLDPEVFNDGTESPPTPCEAYLLGMFSILWRAGLRDPLQSLQDSLNPECLPRSITARPLCPNCHSNLRDWVPKERKTLWEKLPTYFELNEQG